MRRKVGRYMLAVCGALALMSAALPAFADTAVPAAVSACTDFAGLTAKMAGCIRQSIDQGALKFFDEIFPYLQNAISAVMTLAVIVYGIAFAYGAVEKVGRDTYIIMMKVALVAIMCNSSQWIVTTVTGAMDSAAAAVVTFAPAGGVADAAGTDFSQSVCMQNMIEQQAAADPDLPLISPWLAVDCLIDTTIGIHVEPTVLPTHDATWFNKNLESDKKQGLSRSLLYLFFGAMQTSILGLIMAVIGFFFIYGLIMLIVRCFFVYIAGYLGVTFLAIISPLIIPLILFKETKQYFDKFARMFISFSLQPIIMLVFLIFSIAAIDMAVYSGNYSIFYSIAGNASQAPNFNLNDYMADKGIIIKTSSPSLLVKAENPNRTPTTSHDIGGAFNNLAFSDCNNKSAIAAQPALQAKCAFNYPLNLIKTNVSWEKMEAARVPALTQAKNGNGELVPGLAVSRMVLSSIFFCLMTVFILNGLLAVVPMIVGDLLGDLNQSPILGSLTRRSNKEGSGTGIGAMLSKASPSSVLSRLK